MACKLVQFFKTTKVAPQGNEITHKNIDTFVYSVVAKTQTISPHAPFNQSNTTESITHKIEIPYTKIVNEKFIVKINGERFKIVKLDNKNLANKTLTIYIKFIGEDFDADKNSS